MITARDAATVQDLAEKHSDTALTLALDVTDDAQVTAAVAAAEERFGGVDVLVNNAVTAIALPSKRARTAPFASCSTPTSSAPSAPSRLCCRVCAPGARARS